MQRAYATPLQQDYATYTYTPNGQRETVKDANNNLSTFEYDAFDRLFKLRFPVATAGASRAAPITSSTATTPSATARRSASATAAPSASLTTR